MAKWKCDNNITSTALNQLLEILRKKGIPVPKDSRTLMNTPTYTDIIPLSRGTYSHVGFRNSVTYQLKFNLVHFNLDENDLLIDICIDGIPITKSTNVGFWPILGLIRNCPKNVPPFIIGLYFGESKPENANEFLAKFVDEIKDLSNSPIVLNEKVFNIKLRAFCCDTPALSFIKGIKGHTGYFGCSKCTVEGDYKNNRMCFLDINSSLRTDESFLKRMQEEHHKTDSVLEQLPIGMVSQFPLDYMHLVLLGVTKKLIELWLSGPLSVRLTNKHLETINNKLEKIEKGRPQEINRKLRTIQHFRMWKATEFRTFLLYSGPICLKGVLNLNVYEHFMLLNCAIRILCDSKLCLKYSSLANDLLKKFVQIFIEIYGELYVSYNVHNLIHLTDDVIQYGHLDNFSTFKFESYMYQIKRMIKKGHHQLQQVVNRTIEKQNCDLKTNNSRNYPLFKSQLLRETEKYGEITFIEKQLKE